jgi:hypothetical protein
VVGEKSVWWYVEGPDGIVWRGGAAGEGIAVLLGFLLNSPFPLDTKDGFTSGCRWGSADNRLEIWARSEIEPEMWLSWLGCMAHQQKLVMRLGAMWASEYGLLVGSG